MAEIAANDRQRLAELAGQAMYQRDIAAGAAGIELLSIGPGTARMQMRIRAEMVNGHAIAHGAYIFMLADTCFAYACNASNAVSVAQTASITYVSPGRAGERLTAEASEAALAGRTGVYDVRVNGEDGRIVAVFRGVSQRLKGEVVPGLGIAE